MKNIKLKTIIIILALPSFATAQQIITLKECYDAAGKVSQIAGEGAAYTSASALKDKNLASGWFPSLDAGGTIVYNSSVVDMGSTLGALPFPGIADAIKPLPHEQYKVTVDINQTIYDGGIIRNAREAEKAELAVTQKQTETDLYKLRSQVNSCYFGILAAEKQRDLIAGYLSLFSKKIASVSSAADNGMALESDMKALTAEKLKFEQQMNEIIIRRSSLIRILETLTGIRADDKSVLMLPEGDTLLSSAIERPELQLYDLRKEQLSKNVKLIESRRLPRAFGFATLGYGNPPGNNFFKDEFAPYYIVGAGIKWNIFDWNKSKNDKQIISIQQGIIEKRKNDLSESLTRLLEARKADIAAIERMISDDNEIVSLRKDITEAAASKYNNGTITVAEYLNEINNEKQAVLNAELHKINLAMARIDYLNISGKEIE